MCVCARARARVRVCEWVGGRVVTHTSKKGRRLKETRTRRVATVYNLDIVTATTYLYITALDPALTAEPCVAALILTIGSSGPRGVRTCQC